MRIQNNIQRYQYYAFISYSRKDSEWAKWLQKKLENYRLPKNKKEPRSINKTDTLNDQKVSLSFHQFYLSRSYSIMN